MRLTITIAITLFTVSASTAWAADPKTNWGMNCAQCHGADGRAATKMGKQLNAKDPKVQASFTDAQAAKSIKEGVKVGGRTTMKAFGGKLTDDEIKALVAYVRTLKK
jgi:mono/diheme cytochrome c family protein